MMPECRPRVQSVVCVVYSERRLQPQRQKAAQPLGSPDTFKFLGMSPFPPLRRGSQVSANGNMGENYCVHHWLNDAAAAL